MKNGKNTFSTVVSKVETIKVLEKDLQKIEVELYCWYIFFQIYLDCKHFLCVYNVLIFANILRFRTQMYEEMNVPSPLPKPREFYFMRYCVQIESNIWVIVDVSNDYLRQDGPHSSTWKFPSGCMIHHISSGTSHVSEY